MIKNISIRNFKSIKQLDITTTRVNVFIGEHNSGKSNLLEALSWLSINSLDSPNFQEVFRFKVSTDFFFDNDVSNPVEVKTDELSLIIRYAKNENGSILNHLEGLIYPTDSKINLSKVYNFHNLNNSLSSHYAFRLDFNGEISHIGGNIAHSSFRTYIFKKIKSFSNNFRPFLNPPFGDNIPSLLVSNREYRELVSAVFKEKGFRLMLKPIEGDLNMAKDIEDELYAYPYASISETLQRIIFYLLAIETNKNAVLIFDEPEANTFPMYTKQLAEMIALNKSNQFFIATHNPYLLGSLVSKTPKKDLSIFVSDMKKYETKVIRISSTKYSQILDSGFDVYFNLNKFTRK